MIQYQILRNKIISIVWQTVEIITDEISEVKGLKHLKELLSSVVRPQGPRLHEQGGNDE